MTPCEQLRIIFNYRSAVHRIIDVIPSQMVINSRLFRVIRNTKSAITNGRCKIPNIHTYRPFTFPYLKTCYSMNAIPSMDFGGNLHFFTDYHVAA